MLAQFTPAQCMLELFMLAPSTPDSIIQRAMFALSQATALHLSSWAYVMLCQP